MLFCFVLFFGLLEIFFVSSVILVILYVKPPSALYFSFEAEHQSTITEKYCQQPGLFKLIS